MKYDKEWVHFGVLRLQNELHFLCVDNNMMGEDFNLC